MGDSKFGALVLLVLVGVVVGVLPAALADGAVPQAVGNEPITVDYSQPVSVDEDGVTYNETVTVRNSAGTELADTDYDWNATTGEVDWINTTATADGEQAHIDYTVNQITSTSQQLAQFIDIWTVPLALLAMLVLGGTTIAAGRA